MSFLTEFAPIRKYKHVSDAENPAGGSVRQARDNVKHHGPAFHKCNVLFSFYTVTAQIMRMIQVLVYVFLWDILDF